jgi:hypothetical protein
VADEQQRAVELIAAANGQVLAPARLHAYVQALHARPAGRRRWWRRWEVGAAGFAAAAAAAAALLIVWPSARAAPSVTDVAAVAAFDAEAPAVPAKDNPALLAVSADGLPFPDWEDEFGWRATGSRTDVAGDRQLTTVFYEKDGKELAYTIVSGEPLEATGRRLVRKGVELHATDGLVTWQRRHRTCVLVGDVPEATLAKLAVWTGDGAVPA